MQPQRVPIPRAALAALLVAALGLSACGGGSDDAGGGGYGASPTVKPAAASGGDPDPASEGAAATAPATLTAHRGSLGTYLVDGRGRPVYLWEKDTTAEGTCSGPCAEAWPPVTLTGEPKVGAGLHADLAGTTKRADGRLQLTYGGHPLYRFTGDQQSGEPTGQGSAGFGAPWYVVRPSGDSLDGD